MSSHGSFLKRNGEGGHFQKVLYHSAVVVGSANRDFIVKPSHDTMIIALKYLENIYNNITYFSCLIIVVEYLDLNVQL